MRGSIRVDRGGRPKSGRVRGAGAKKLAWEAIDPVIAEGHLTDAEIARRFDCSRGIVSRRHRDHHTQSLRPQEDVVVPRLPELMEVLGYPLIIRRRHVVAAGVAAWRARALIERWVDGGHLVPVGQTTNRRFVVPAAARWRPPAVFQAAWRRRSQVTRARDGEVRRRRAPSGRRRTIGLEDYVAARAAVFAEGRSATDREVRERLRSWGRDVSRDSILRRRHEFAHLTSGIAEEDVAEGVRAVGAAADVDSVDSPDQGWLVIWSGAPDVVVRVTAATRAKARWRGLLYLRPRFPERLVRLFEMTARRPNKR